MNLEANNVKVQPLASVVYIKCLEKVFKSYVNCEYIFSTQILYETTSFKLTFQLNSFMLDMRGNITILSYYLSAHGEDVSSTILMSFSHLFCGQLFVSSLIGRRFQG